MSDTYIEVTIAYYQTFTGKIFLKKSFLQPKRNLLTFVE